jgi:type I restriction enzyme, S subunit
MRSGQPGINGNEYASMLLPLPPIHEQQAIAKVLNDVDEVIRRLEHLLLKKRDLKQATMQQLLTGKTRLEGFSGEWEVKTLNDVAVFLDGARRPIKDSDRAKMRGEYPYFGASGIVDYVNDYIFDEPLILLGEDGENILSRNTRLAFQVSGKIWVNNHAHVLRPNPDTNITYLTEYLEGLNYEQYNTGTAQPKLNKKICAGIPVVLPPFPEQMAIASVLSDMDAELAGLEEKLDKTKALKQGMMQQLLTGRIRLL